MRTDFSYANYRQVVQQIEPPCVPFLYVLYISLSHARGCTDSRISFSDACVHHPNPCA